LGNFRRAEDAYKELLDTHDISSDVHLNIACCYFYQQMYEEAEKAAEKGPCDSLQNRILFNISHRVGDETKLMQYHQNLKDKKDDQLSLAAVHYLRSHHQEVCTHSFSSLKFIADLVCKYVRFLIRFFTIHILYSSL
jgi:intraflagellar transport protein 56